MYQELANFFWHGAPLSLQEYVCLSSFIKNGFNVCVYSYTDLVLPKCAKLCDASEILPASDLGKYTQEGMTANLTAFSDAFRYNLIKKKGGWWFDTDVLCLASSDQFAQIVAHKEIKISAGYQNPDLIACGVLYLDDSCLIDKVLDELENAGTEFDWGEIGPTLISRVLIESNLAHLVEPEAHYYPIPYSHFRRMLDPGWTDWCKSRVNGSLAVHLWNEVRRRDRVPNSLMPPEGSFLYEAFVKVCPELEGIPALSFETIQALFDYSDLKNEHQKLICDYKRLIAFEQNVKNNHFMSLLFALHKLYKR